MFSKNCRFFARPIAKKSFFLLILIVFFLQCTSSAIYSESFFGPFSDVFRTSFGRVSEVFGRVSDVFRTFPDVFGTFSGRLPDDFHGKKIVSHEKSSFFGPSDR